MLVVLAAALVLPALALDARPQAPQGRPDYAAAKARYDADLERPALFIRARSITRLAATRDPRALPILVKRYKEPGEPADHVRYLTAAIAAHFFSQARYVPAFDAWADKYKTSEHAWLWFNAARVHAKNAGSAKLAVTATTHPNAYRRAAAIEALAIENRSTVLELIPKALKAAPAKGLDRSLVAEGCAAALRAMRKHRGTAPFRAAASAVIGLLDDRKLADRSKLVVARMLRDALDADAVSLQANFWRAKLNASGAPERGGRALQSAPPFMGIRAAGNRLVYVIDLSDSMLTPLSDRERKELKGVITRGPGEAAPKPARGSRRNDAERDLPWEKIETRFDAAREFLKLALRKLSKRTSFMVITFGDRATALSATPKLVPARKKVVAKAIEALDAIRAGPTRADRPYGTLEGNTNLHGGLRLAFRSTAGELIQEYEHVAKAGFDSGADTIFLLSDGAPSWDDFEAVDTRDPEDQAGDPETRRALANQPKLRYYGPYVNWPDGDGWPYHIVNDVRRLNLFRKVEIHCVGIGEADPELLQKIAEIGGGTLKRIGAGRR